jgi:hypothetical protein
MTRKSFWRVLAGVAGFCIIMMFILNTINSEFSSLTSHLVNTTLNVLLGSYLIWWGFFEGGRKK